MSQVSSSSPLVANVSHVNGTCNRRHYNKSVAEVASLHKKTSHRFCHRVKKSGLKILRTKDSCTVLQFT